MNDKIEFADFQKIDIRAGRIVSVHAAEGCRIKAYKLAVDFGPELGVKRSLAQITHYSEDELMGKLVLGVVNLHPRKIGPHLSEVLVTGMSDERGDVMLATLDGPVPLGQRLF